MESIKLFTLRKIDCRPSFCFWAGQLGIVDTAVPALAHTLKLKVFFGDRQLFFMVQPLCHTLVRPVHYAAFTTIAVCLTQ